VEAESGEADASGLIDCVNVKYNVTLLRVESRKNSVWQEDITREDNIQIILKRTSVFLKLSGFDRFVRLCEKGPRISGRDRQDECGGSKMII
jgi:hypothetical protein